MKNLIPTLIFLLGLAGTMNAQTVVLINGVPTKVILEGTKIVSVQGEATGYLVGYPTATSDFDYGTTDPVAVQNNVDAYADSVNELSSTSSRSATPAPAQPQTASIIGNYFKFDNNSALLSELAINEIKDYASKVKAGTASMVILESFFKQGDTRSKELVENRLAACKKYFEVNGVNSSTITTNLIPDGRQTNKVSITLK